MEVDLKTGWFLLSLSRFYLTSVFVNRNVGTGVRGLMRGMATLPQGNQELLVVRDKVGRPPGELGVSKSMECDILPFSALTLLVDRKGIRSVKTLDVKFVGCDDLTGALHDLQLQLSPPPPSFFASIDIG